MLISVTRAPRSAWTPREGRCGPLRRGWRLFGHSGFLQRNGGGLLTACPATRTFTASQTNGCFAAGIGPLSLLCHPHEIRRPDAKLRPTLEQTGGNVYWTKSSGLLASADPTNVSVPRVTMLTAARVLSGSNWMGLRDREAYVTRGVKLTPMFTGMLALAALLFLITLAWWREGR